MIFLYIALVFYFAVALFSFIGYMIVLWVVKYKGHAINISVKRVILESLTWPCWLFKHGSRR